MKEQLLARVARHDGALRLVIFDLSSSPQVDLAGVRMLGDLHDRLDERGVALELVEAHQQVRELLRRADGMDTRFGHVTRRTTCNMLLEEFLAQSAPGVTGRR